MVQTAGCVRNPGALSTGEAIGTGMSILVMVVQSWKMKRAVCAAKTSRHADCCSRMRAARLMPAHCHAV